LNKKCGSFGIIINGLNSYEHYFDGFCIYESEQCQLVNAHIHSNEAAGISLDWSANNNSFKNIKLERNKDLSIFMRDSNNNMFDTILFMHTGVYLNHRDNDINSGCFNNLFININMPPVFIGPHCKQNLFIPAKK
jgi:nitrous oxidase accessory protein NosD